MVRKIRIEDRSSYTCGPYQGYFGEATWDDDDEEFHGEIVGTRDVVTFVGSTPKELRQAFKDSVDVYLEFCRELGKEPEKPFSGKLLTRLAPSLHRKLSALAIQSNLSLNQLINNYLQTAVNASEAARTAATRKKPRKPAASPKPRRRTVITKRGA